MVGLSFSPYLDQENNFRWNHHQSNNEYHHVCCTGLFQGIQSVVNLVYVCLGAGGFQGPPTSTSIISLRYLQTHDVYLVLNLMKVKGLT